MVAKKTAVQHSASGRSTGASGGSAEGGSGGAAVKGAGRKKRVGTAVGKAEEKTEAEQTVVGSAAVKKTAAKRAVAGKVVEREGDAEKGAVAQGGAEESAAARKATAKSVAKKSAAKKSTTKSTSTKSTGKKAGAAQAAETTGATTVVAKNTPGTATAAKKPTAVPKARPAAAAPGELAVRPGEDPWTPAEVAEARTELMSEALRLRNELEASGQALTGLMRDSGDGAGDDQADTGAKNITREHELALAHNAREMLDQTERALERLDAGTYGLCENCGKPIGKARMQAFPRATLCVECKQRQERR